MRAMKDSGIAWIGEIPEDWEIARIKQLFSEVNDRCESSENYTLLSVSEYYGIAPKSEKISDDDMLTHAETLDGYKICKENDLVARLKTLCFFKSQKRHEGKFPLVPLH